MMITQKKQPLKRVSYIGLSFFSLMLLFDAQAEKPTSPYTAEDQEIHRENRNRIATKRGLPQRSAPSHQGPTLGEEVRKWRRSIGEITAAIRESNEQETRFIKGGAKLLIDSKVKDEETKSAFYQFLDGFFSE